MEREREFGDKERVTILEKNLGNRNLARLMGPVSAVQRTLFRSIAGSSLQSEAWSADFSREEGGRFMLTVCEDFGLADERERSEPHFGVTVLLLSGGQIESVCVHGGRGDLSLGLVGTLLVNEQDKLRWGYATKLTNSLLRAAWTEANR